MKRVLLLAATTGYQIRSFGDAAEGAGVRLVFASDRCDQLDDPWWDAAIPVRFNDDERSLASIVAAFGNDRPAGILAVGDRPTVLAAQAAAAFGLPGNPVVAAQASRNKLATRRALASAGLHVPRFHSCAIDDDARRLAADIGYPVVVKPLALSGSRGVMRADDERGLLSACERLRAILAAPDVRADRDPSHQQALVESFIPGQEYAVEGVLTNGVFRAFAIFDKPDPLDGPLFEETIYVTPSRARSEDQRRILEAVAAAARALGLTHGPVHAECRLNASGVYVLEVGARPIGGLCSRALRFAPPEERAPARCASLEDVLLRHALGEDPGRFVREGTASGVMMIPIPRRGVYRGVTGLDAACAVPGIDEILVTAKPDTVLVPLPEGRSYLGFIFAHAATADAAERALRAAHARLAFAIEREVRLVADA